MLNTDLEITRANSKSFSIAVTSNGAALDITGGTLRFTAKYDHADADDDAVFTRVSPSGGITITDEDGGLATLAISPSNTTSLPISLIELVYDLQLTDVDSNVYTLARGTLRIYPNVSRTTP